MKRTRPGTFVMGKGKPAFKKQAGVKEFQSPRQQPQRREEKKDLTTTTPSVIVFGQTTAVVGLINGIAQGVGSNQHVGRSVRLESVLYRWTGQVAATTTGASALRLVIVYDKQPNGALPNTTDVFLADSIEQPMNLNNNHRFRVIVDELVENIGTAGPQAFYKSGFRKMDLPEEFSANSAAVTSITTGTLVAYVWQSGGLLVANPASVLMTRVRFSDA